MPRVTYIAILFLFANLSFAESIKIKESEEVTLNLSRTNYNRVFLKNDEIYDFAYPENALALKKDKGDGSVYLMPISSDPFTLFVTTKAGHHFTFVLSSEESLGKTIELEPLHSLSSPPKTTLATSPPSSDKFSESIVNFIKNMEGQKAPQGIKVSHPFGKVERWGQGLALQSKEIWEGDALKGEVIELYNGASKPLTLSQTWFDNEKVLGIKFSKSIIGPHEKAHLYRVSEVSHG